MERIKEGQKAQQKKSVSFRLKLILFIKVICLIAFIEYLIMVGCTYAPISIPQRYTAISEALLLALLCSWPLWKFIIEPIEKLKQLAMADAIQKQMEMVRSEKLVQLGQISSGMAHEINNPLTIIMGQTQILRKNCQNGISLEDAVETLRKIEAASRRISIIVEGLRVFSCDYERGPLAQASLIGIIENLEKLCRERFHYHHIQLEIDRPSNDVLIECRAGQILQILFSLLSNSSDAIHDLPEKWIKLKITCTSSHVICSIIDSGKGIPAGIQEKLMTPFFTTRPTGQGRRLGLELSISLALAQEHQGELFYDKNCPNTCFVLKLPLSQEKSQVQLKTA